MIKPLQIDLRQGLDAELLQQVRVVIMCLDQTDTAFLQACLKHGIHYIDVSASYEFLAEAERLHAEAVSGRATAVLSVGLAPGLTNLMARGVAMRMDAVETIDISIMLGLGDEHGQAAIEGTVDSMNARFEVVEKGRPERVASFSDGRAATFGDRWGRRTAYRFPFPDQYVIPRTTGAPTVSTRLCFDSAAVTGLLAALKATGLLRLLNIRAIRERAVRLFGKVQVGAPAFAVKVEATGTKGGKPGAFC